MSLLQRMTGRKIDLVCYKFYNVRVDAVLDKISSKTGEKFQ